MDVRTIDDLLEYADHYHFNLHKMRFKIGENTQDARYIGIYQDEESEKWIAYRNRSDGTRIILYEGYSEKAAVEKIYEKIQYEIERKRQATTVHTRRAKVQGFMVLGGIILILVAVALYCANHTTKHKNGYYVEDNHIFYVQNEQIYYLANNTWYLYPDQVSEKWYKNNYFGTNYDFEDSADEFYYSVYYEEEYYDSNEDDEYDSSHDEQDQHDEEE